MDREKFVQVVTEFSFGFLTCSLVLAGVYSVRNGLYLGTIFSGALLIYLVYLTARETP